ncbi:hypothetical protein LINGRAHAP2_LOCUS14394 [Linum grandiflorum]
MPPKTSQKRKCKAAETPAFCNSTIFDQEKLQDASDIRNGRFFAPKTPDPKRRRSHIDKRSRLLPMTSEDVVSLVPIDVPTLPHHFRSTTMAGPDGSMLNSPTTLVLPANAAPQSRKRRTRVALSSQSSYLGAQHLPQNADGSILTSDLDCYRYHKRTMCVLQIAMFRLHLTTSGATQQLT